MPYPVSPNSKILVSQETEEFPESRVVQTFLISREEELRWKAYHDMVRQSVKSAEALLRGFFGLQVTALDLEQGMSVFQPGKWKQLLVNHAQKLDLGKACFVRYGSLQAMLTKRVTEEWGKVDVQFPIEIYSRPLSQLDLYLKKINRETAGLNPPVIFCIRDLSVKPIFRFGDEEQTLRLRKFFKQETAAANGGERRYFWDHQDRRIDLAVTVQGYPAVKVC